MFKQKTNRMLVLLALAATVFSGSAQAQNVVTVPTTTTVQNAITLTLVDPLDFATIFAINDSTETATATVSTGDAISFATSGAPAITGAVSGTPTAGEVTAAGVVGATIFLDIQTVVSPTDGTDTLALGTFLVNVNGGGDVALTPGTPISYTATALDTILIGGTITTPAQVAQIGDGTYNGSFDLTATY